MLATVTPIPYREVLHPKFWPTWIGLGILRAITLLPYSWQSRLGEQIGNFTRQLARKRVQIARTNLALCFPEKSERERETILKAQFRELGKMTLDTAVSWWSSPRKLASLGRITGMEYLEDALKQGRGAILLTGHMTSLDIGGLILAQALSQTPHLMQVMYKRSRNRLMETMVRRGRERFTRRVFVRQDMRSFVKGLKENLPSWYAPDQDFGRKSTVFADFFSIPTATLPTTANIAARTGAAVVPYFPIRLPNDEGFEIRIYPALENFPTDDSVADATLTNKLLEDIIREFPEQYLWVHRRFKTRPEGLPPVY